MGNSKYTKEGKGISKPNYEKRRIFVFFDEYGRKFGNLIKLNILYFVSILPALLGFILMGDEKYRGVALVLFLIGILTFGPFTAAFTYALRNYVRGHHVWLISDFFGQFKKNYRQSVMLGAIDIIFPVILYNAFFYYAQFGTVSTLIGGGLMILVGVLFIIMNFYAYPMIVTFDLKMSYILRNSLLFAIAKFPVNLFLLVVNALIIYIMNFGVLVIILPLIGLSTMGFLTVFTVWKYISDTMIDEEENGEDAVFSDENLLWEYLSMQMRVL